MAWLTLIPELFRSAWEMFVTHAPGRVGNRLRYRYWKGRLAHLGQGVTIDVGAFFQNPGRISIDDNAWIDRGVIILAGPPKGDRVTFSKPNPDFRLEIGEVRIGKYTHIAPYCVLSGIGGLSIGDCCGIASHSAIYSYSHHYRNLLDRSDDAQYAFTTRARPDQQSMILGPVVIADYCAVGLHSVLLPGTSLHRGAWIASGTVFTGTASGQTMTSNTREPSTRSIAMLRIRA
jgi:acetyltransferase-like isoleucine patch superfamily enzyme